MPGSYLIRDFAKHIITLSATCNKKEVGVRKINKSTWQCDPCKGELCISYQVYCFDAAPRGAYVDNQRVFFDGCRIFLVVDGEEEQTRSLEIVRPKDPRAKKWKCATSMRQVKVDKDGYGTYVADNHLDLIDHPCEISDFSQYDFVVADVQHSLIINGPVVGDVERFVQDLQKVCQGHVDFFGELPKMERYIFVLHVHAEAYGGIEHKYSCVLSCSRRDFPMLDTKDSQEQYRDLLGLCSHEYFHLWNVKRIKPEIFVNPNLNTEAYTRQLWIFEGITSYYDNLNLVRQNLITTEEYLQILQKDLTRLAQNPGAYVQSLEDSSFDTWIKFYQPNENSVNSMVSYYGKGSIAALVLDLTILSASNGAQSLADVMQVLWQQYGKTGLGLPENYFERVTFEVTGEDYSNLFELMLRTTEELPLPELLLGAGVVYRRQDAKTLESMGAQTSRNKQQSNRA